MSREEIMNDLQEPKEEDHELERFLSIMREYYKTHRFTGAIDKQAALLYLKEVLAEHGMIIHLPEEPTNQRPPHCLDCIANGGDFECDRIHCQKGLKFCEYCNEDVHGLVTPLEENGHAFIQFGTNGWELNMGANGWHGSAKIRYCPMCGRDLYVK